MTVSLLNSSYQQAFQPITFVGGSEDVSMPTNNLLVVNKPIQPFARKVRSGLLSPDAVSAAQWYHRCRRLPTDLPDGYSIMDFGSRLNVIFNNLLRVTQAWGWDFTIGEHRIYQPSHHPWETTERDIGNNFLNDRLIKLVKGEFLSNVFLDGFMQPALLSQPRVLKHTDSFQERAGKLWHNWVRHPFQQGFGLSAHPSITVGHILPAKQSHWLKIKPMDTNIELLKEYGRQLSLQTTFENIQSLIVNMPALLKDKQTSFSLVSDYIRKGSRVELKKLMVALEPQPVLQPLVTDALKTLFDKEGALAKDAHQQVPQIEAILNYHLALYQPSGGVEASAQAIKQFLNRIVALPLPDKPVLGYAPAVPETQQAVAEKLTTDWLNNINKAWRKEADNAIRRTTAEIGHAVAQTYNELWQELNPTLQPGAIANGSNPKPVPVELLAQRFATTVAPTLFSKQGNQGFGKLAPILEPAFQLSKRSALLNEYEDHRNKALLVQTITQALFTCFVLGNLLFFVVFNTFARLDADFKGPNGETRLDFGEMKRGINRWIQRQLGRDVSEPPNRSIKPQVSLEYSLGARVAQFQQKVIASAPAALAFVPFSPASQLEDRLQPSNYLKQTVLDILPASAVNAKQGVLGNA